MLTPCNVGSFIVMETPEKELHLRLLSVIDQGYLWYKYTPTGWEEVTTEFAESMERQFRAAEREALSTIIQDVKVKQ